LGAAKLQSAPVADNPRYAADALMYHFAAIFYQFIIKLCKGLNFSLTCDIVFWICMKLNK